jgi:hypothetical protein
MSLAGVTCRRRLVLDDWIYYTLYINNSGLQAIKALTLICTHAVDFLVFTTRIPETDL